MNQAQITAPILSVSDLGAQQTFFCAGLGMQPAGVTSLDIASVADLCGMQGHSLESRYLHKHPTDFGVRLWQFSPSSSHTIRSEQQGTDRDALKVVDFYAPDFDAAIASLRAQGYHPRDAIAEYTLPQGRFQEAHFWRSDGIVCAILSGPPDFFAEFATVTDQLVSEPQSISAPVSDQAAVMEFYETVFGFKPVFRYQVNNPSFDALVGAAKPLKLAAVNMGNSTREPYLGVIDYGSTVQLGKSLKGASRPPSLGLIGVEISVRSLDQVIERALACHGNILGEPCQLDTYAPLGPCRSCLLEGPHGVLHHLLEPLTR